jgi:hypothetical protein
MKYRVHTRSGAMYTLDTEEGTWVRRTPKSGQGIVGINTDRGELLPGAELVITIGDRLEIDILNNGVPSWIRTTPVVSAEDIT